MWTCAVVAYHPMPTPQSSDRYRGYRFTLELDGKPLAHFQECSLTASPPLKRGMRVSGRITLKSGVVADPHLRDWLRGGVRSSGAIVLRDATGVRKQRWKLTAASAEKWTGPTLDASANSVVIETLEIAHEGVEPED